MISTQTHHNAGQQGSIARPLLITISLLAGLALAGWLILAPAKSQKAPPPRPTPSVLVSSVELETVEDKVEAIGTISANESVMITSKVTDRIHRVHFEEGAEVKKGDLLVELDSDEIAAELQEAKAALDDATRQLERTRTLISQGAVSASSLDERETAFQGSKARVDLFQTRLAERKILAPFDGVMGLRNVSPGRLVTQDQGLVEIFDLDPVKLDFTVPEQFLGTLVAGLDVKATSVAYPDEVFTGKVALIAPSVDPISRSVRARALLENPDRKLKPGMLMNVSAILGSHEVLMIPETAIAPVGNSKYVFKLTEDNKAARAAVRTGSRRGNRVRVLEGLQPGDRVITHGYSAKDGMPVVLKAESEVFTVQRKQETPKSEGQ